MNPEYNRLLIYVSSKEIIKSYSSTEIDVILLFYQSNASIMLNDILLQDAV